MTADPHDLSARAASFSRGAGNYSAVRPGYPDDAVRFLVPDGAARVLDLAAGTGKLTTSLVARGLDVVAVEPSAPMLDELRRALPGVETHVGTAESLPLPEGAVDAVVVGQAWHWFDAEAASAEIARVLRPGGTVGVVWNDRDDAVDWVARFGEILHRGDRLEPTVQHVAPRFGDAFGEVEHQAFRWEDEISPGSLRPLAASRSYLLLLPDDEREELLGAVDELAATHPDLAGRARVPLPYVTNAYRAQRH